jgi:5-methylthioadenosine/S-adenosylhomocysteine deaminase
MEDILRTNPESIRQIVEIAKKLDIPIVANYLEKKNDKDYVKEQYNQSSADYLKSNNAFDIRLILSNAVWADELDLLEFQFHNVSIVSNPISNCLTGSGIGDIKFFIEGGINVSVGTDRIENCGTLDMLSELRNCACTQKVLYKTPSAILAKKLLEMATIKGAKTLGIAKEVGTIEVGKKADIIMIDTSNFNNSSSDDIYSKILYLAKGDDVITTIVNGKIIMENRKILTIDEKIINEKIKEIIK